MVSPLETLIAGWLPGRGLYLATQALRGVAGLSLPCRRATWLGLPGPSRSRLLSVLSLPGRGAAPLGRGGRGRSGALDPTAAAVGGAPRPTSEALTCRGASLWGSAGWGPRSLPGEGQATRGWLGGSPHRADCVRCAGWACERAAAFGSWLLSRLRDGWTTGRRGFARPVRAAHATLGVS